MSNYTRKSLRWVLSSGIILFLFSGLVADNSFQERQVSAASQVSETGEMITDEEIRSLTEQFMDILVQEADTDYKVANYQTTQGLLQAFSEVASRDLAAPYIDFFYEQKEDGLYILPTELPPWFIQDNSYETEQVDAGKVKVSQTNETIMYGAYRIELEFTKRDSWKITDINVS
ncbi:hypothetical protein [Lentibacillus sediminis]|uniref:hypothetical protein n=1 Tax=Lentibacillus sediminis TaxID=1940529 RepID=UPI000C1BAABF|nr:hypothetical protein [Lentibacillus sediminis]